jgi:uncharacterized Zn-binding protein involved in type VI secretion
MGRVGDRARAPEDSHGGLCCDHDVIGPATTGSADVLVGDAPALRVGDQGVHDGCCDDGTWVAVGGSASVLVNDRPAHGVGDATRHCGGDGALVEGAGDVLVGDG